MKMCFLQFGVLAKIQQQKQKKLIGISIAFFLKEILFVQMNFSFTVLTITSVI